MKGKRVGVCLWFLRSPPKKQENKGGRKLNQQELQKFSAFCLFSIERYMVINYFSPRKFVWLRRVERTIKPFLIYCALLQTFRRRFPFFFLYLKPYLHVCLIQLSEEMENFQFMFLLSFGSEENLLIYGVIYLCVRFRFRLWTEVVQRLRRRKFPEINNFLIDQVYDFSYSLTGREKFTQSAH